MFSEKGAHPFRSFGKPKFNAMNPSVNYYNSKKYCPSCREYVRYLQSIDESFCVACGSKVRLFSTADKKAFLEGLKSEKQARKDKRVS